MTDLTDMTDVELAILGTEDEKLLFTMVRLAGALEYIFTALAMIAGLLFLIALFLGLIVFGVV